QRKRGWRNWLAAHPLEIAVLALLVVALAVPIRIEGVGLKMRLVTPLFMFAAMLPKFGGDHRLARWLTRGLAGTAILIFALLMQHLIVNFKAFHRNEIEPMVEVIDKIPKESRVFCSNIPHSHPRLYHYVLLYNCPGLATFRRKAFTGGNFADTLFNAVQFRSGFRFPGVGGGWMRNARVSQWDYVIVRGKAPRPDQRYFERVASSKRLNQRMQWHLFRVKRFSRYKRVGKLHGGLGGFPNSIFCPPDEQVVRISGARVPGRPNLIMGVRMGCCPKNKKRCYGRSRMSLQMGRHHYRSSFSMTCPKDFEPTGVHGRSSNSLHQLGLICRNGSSSWRSVLQGGTGGRPFQEECPKGRRLVGLFGRAAAWMDGIGILCAPSPSSSTLPTSRAVTPASP
ncbi:MAG: hypothetical protein AAGJ35_09380, partial [Myxococcota bacterium]